MKNLAVLPFLFLLALNSCVGKKDDASVIRVGEVASLSGSEATFGQATHEGMVMAIEQINAAGGINNKKLELITLDDQSKSEEAALAITKLITHEKVVAVLGEVASSRSLAMAPIAQQYQIPMISPSSTNPKVTQVGDYIFRACFIDPFQGTVMAQFARETLKVKTVALLTDLKSDYSVGLSEYFTKTFRSKGGSVVVEQSYSTGDIDFKAQLTSIKAKKPDAIFLSGYYTDVGLIARQARELGIKVPFLGGDGWDSPKLTEIAGPAIEGGYFSNHYSTENTSPLLKGFIEKYRAKFGALPEGPTALGFDAAFILTDALKRTKSLAGRDLRQAIAETKNLAAMTGTISFDENRNPQKSAVILKVENGKFKFFATIKPD